MGNGLAIVLGMAVATTAGSAAVLGGSHWANRNLTSQWVTHDYPDGVTSCSGDGYDLSGRISRRTLLAGAAGLGVAGGVALLATRTTGAARAGLQMGAIGFGAGAVVGTIGAFGVNALEEFGAC